MRFVSFLEAAQYGDRVLDGWLTNIHRLETALKRRILFDVQPILIERGRAHHAQLPSREERFEHVAGVHRAFGFTRADECVHFVNEHDEQAIA